MKGITSFFEFIYEPEGIRVFKQAGIGAGKLINWPAEEKMKRIYQYRIDDWAGNTVPVDFAFMPTIESEKQKLINGEKMEFWHSYQRKATQRIITAGHNTIIQEDNLPEKEWECAEETCDATFSNFVELEQHYIAEPHHQRLQKITLLDAVQTYKEVLEEVDRTRMLPIVKDALMQHVMPVNPDEIDVEEGYALHTRKSPTRFSTAVRKALNDAFDEGEGGQRKWNGLTFSTHMSSLTNEDGTRVFKASEIPSPVQIDRYFSTRKRQKQLFPEKFSQTGIIVFTYT